LYGETGKTWKHCNGQYVIWIFVKHAILTGEIEVAPCSHGEYSTDVNLYN